MVKDTQPCLFVILQKGILSYNGHRNRAYVSVCIDKEKWLKFILKIYEENFKKKCKGSEHLSAQSTYECLTLAPNI